MQIFLYTSLRSSGKYQFHSARFLCQHMIYVTRKERTLYFVKYCDLLKLLLQVCIRSLSCHQSSNSTLSTVRLRYLSRYARGKFVSVFATLFSRTLGVWLNENLPITQWKQQNARTVLTVSAQDVRFQFKFRTWTGFPKLQINCTRKCTAFPRVKSHWAIKWL